jgi:hypothetical protein
VEVRLVELTHGHQSASPDRAQIHRLMLGGGLLGLGLALQLEGALLHLDHPHIS